MKIVLIAAVSENGVIGQGGKIPWHIPEDLKRFKALTMGHVVLMGRKTWESLPEKYRPLPGRYNIVLSSSLAENPYLEGALAVPTVEAAQMAAEILCGQTRDLYVIGGRRVYEDFLPLADRIEFTRVHRTVEADDPDTRVFFPGVYGCVWDKGVASIPFTGPEVTFETYERRAEPQDPSKV